MSLESLFASPPAPLNSDSELSSRSPACVAGGQLKVSSDAGRSTEEGKQRRRVTGLAAAKRARRKQKRMEAAEMVDAKKQKMTQEHTVESKVPTSSRTDTHLAGTADPADPVSLGGFGVFEVPLTHMVGDVGTEEPRQLSNRHQHQVENNDQGAVDEFLGGLRHYREVKSTPAAAPAATAAELPTGTTQCAEPVRTLPRGAKRDGKGGGRHLTHANGGGAPTGCTEAKANGGKDQGTGEAHVFVPHDASDNFGVFELPLTVMVGDIHEGKSPALRDGGGGKRAGGNNSFVDHDNGGGGGNDDDDDNDFMKELSRYQAAKSAAAQATVTEALGRGRGSVLATFQRGARGVRGRFMGRGRGRGGVRGGATPCVCQGAARQQHVHHPLQKNPAEMKWKKRNKNKPKKTLPPKQKPKYPCKFYLDGRCTRGVECTFSHEGTPGNKREICKFYLNSICSKGVHCLYMHTDFPCKFYHTGTKCFAGDNCRFSHEGLTDETKELLLKCLNVPKEKTEKEKEKEEVPESSKFYFSVAAPKTVEGRAPAHGGDGATPGVAGPLAYPGFTAFQQQQPAPPSSQTHHLTQSAMGKPGACENLPSPAALVVLQEQPTVIPAEPMTRTAVWDPRLVRCSQHIRPELDFPVPDFARFATWEPSSDEMANKARFVECTEREAVFPGTADRERSSVVGRLLNRGGSSWGASAHHGAVHNLPIQAVIGVLTKTKYNGVFGERSRQVRIRSPAAAQTGAASAVNNGTTTTGTIVNTATTTARSREGGSGEAGRTQNLVDLFKSCDPTASPFC